jgi:hypothetical protein
LIDEGYEYRTPTDIYLKKGWNQIMVKAPIGSFRGKRLAESGQMDVYFCGSEVRKIGIIIY